MDYRILFVKLIGFTLFGAAIHRFVRGGLRAPLIVALSMVTIYWAVEPPSEHFFRYGFLLPYPLFVILQYLLMTRVSRVSVGGRWLSILFPVGFLFAVRYLSGPLMAPVWSALGKRPLHELTVYMVGLSYMAFRLSYATLEFATGAVKQVGFAPYCAFAFNPPTLFVGPINRLSTYLAGWENPSLSRAQLLNGAFRVVVGMAKYLFLGTLLGRLSYDNLLLDGNPHPLIDLMFSIVAFQLFLYCNFSGFCDVAVGLSGIMGIPIEENFESPFLARNIKEFWNRWHITLSAFMKDIVFSPSVMELSRKVGVRQVNHIAPLITLGVFLMIGVWHGAGFHFLVYGALHGGAMVVHHYYSLLLRGLLPKPSYQRYMASPAIRMGATLLTFLFAASSLFFFANDFTRIERILLALSIH